MLFGANTMTFYSLPVLQAIENIALCGFDCVEIWLDHAWDEIKGASTHQIAATVAAYNLSTTVHCPIIDINIASPNRGIRAESIKQILAGIDFAKELDSKLIVIHPGHKFSPREADQLHWSYQVDAMKQILVYAEQQQVIVAVENMTEGEEHISVQNWPDLARLFQACGAVNQYVTLDTTHLRETGAVLEFIAQARHRITHLHLSDSTSTQMHLPLGTGNLDLVAISRALQEINYTGICSLECFIPGDQELLQKELAKAKHLFQAPR